MLLLLLGAAGCAHIDSTGAKAPLRVSADGHHLEQADGRPFFWLADTAWELLHRATREESEAYLEDRRRKGFSVVQTVILAELGGLRIPNAAGDLPLIDRDPERPNPAYFEHVDDVLRIAEAKGIHLALLPTWGDKFNRKWGEGPEIFTPGSARAFGAFLGKRYAGRSVIWVLGGDRDPETQEHRAIIRAMAEGIDSATGGRQLITYHPQGGSKSWTWFRNEPWIDFHMFQSGHGKADFANYAYTLEGRALQPAKPVIDGEPPYEDHPIDWKPELGWFDASEVRRAAWWSLLAGAAGHSYGNHNIWQMWQPGRHPISSARTPWRQALGQPGATQMGYMRRLLESRRFGTLEPAQHLLASAGSGSQHQRAAATADLRSIIVYTPFGREVTIVPAAIAAGGQRATWFDPRTGTSQAAEASPTAASFDPPGNPGRGNDWVLVLDAPRVRRNNR